MVLEMKNICKDYYRGKTPVPVLRNVNMQVHKGDYIAIMGPSGSGKTTLMNIMGCLDLATSGSFVLEDQDIGSMDDDRLAEIRNQYIGFVFQNFYLLPKMDALDNVALPLLYAGVSLKERRERAQQALTAVGLEDRIHFMPNQLSGGQCQRVAIARAIVTEPQLLLADEPTGALDTVAGEQIMGIFRKLADSGMTIVMITHEPEIAACADQILHIRDGQLLDPDRNLEQFPEEPEQYPLPNLGQETGEKSQKVLQEESEDSFEDIIARADSILASEKGDRPDEI